MVLTDDVSLTIVTMVVGAVLGAVITPLGDAFVSLILERKKRSRHLHSALLLFFVANGIWICGELMQIWGMYRASEIRWPTVSVMGGIHGLAALTFAIGLRHLPNDEDASKHKLAHALFLLIVGNMLWLGSAMLEILLWALWPAWGYSATAISTLVLIIPLALFVKGARDAWYSIPQHCTMHRRYK
jgi:hypothetical protein